MNRSYLSYFKDRNPFRFITNIFRNYKKTSDKVKRNHSEPTVAQQPHSDGFNSNKPKSELNLCNHQRDKHIEQWTNSKFDDNASQVSLKLIPSSSRLNTVSSNISLKKTCCHIDLNIQEKLSHIPVNFMESKKSDSLTKIPLKRAYPWQNFNLANAQKPKYDEIKEVSDMRSEIINMRKSILRRPDAKLPVEREIPAKEVKFNKTASMLIYPKNPCNVMKQARINLSTNTIGAEKNTTTPYRKKKSAIVNTNKVNNVKACCPNNYRKTVKKLRKCLPVEHGHFWYLGNAKKQKIF